MFEDIYKQLVNEVDKGHQCVTLTYIDLLSTEEGSIIKKVILTKESIEKKSFPVDDNIYEKICNSLESGKLEMVEIGENKNVLIEPFVPKPRLVVFGGGHIAKPVTEFASRVGFSVTVIDDRPFFANKPRFPEAEKVICESFEKSFDLINLEKSDYIVIVTRGHRYDGVVLRKVLKYDLSYVGMIGSRRRVTAMKKELSEEGFSKEKLELVNAPIGIDINAITPDEIAISIIAQLINFKNKETMSKFGKNFAIPEFDKEVLKNVSEKSPKPKACITILSSKGSVPRKAGAKMITYPDGMSVGTIGGGCSESSVLQKAREMMRKTTGERSFFIEHVDMTGDVAESEGMVCGGTMEVLIEVI
ncbi:putative xanthine dehydrogenase subunit A [Clostridium ragsdalei P11]|uniref:Putative xanthine dehydrogenase subunit A n=1 Tax=Clostridium ragsdalei P11 TaxID=1353534 RepID=A0A1A6B4E0_9CLOT|nr:XdhC/CoxI family protein [Clostridium ragsdalei]OBR97150.1 putative xanthine dehydrogenase subunit A [Clostridium ragsdalei P11]